MVKEASWANIRDKLLTGENQVSHCLFGMPFSVNTGVGGTAGKELPDRHGAQHQRPGDHPVEGPLRQVGFRDLDKVAAGGGGAARHARKPTFAMTFPGGTHDIWLRYWLAAAKVAQSSVKIITIPPPQMVANMKAGNMDGFCVGEPWGGVAVEQDIGFTHISTQDLWKHHPEKALVFNKEFAEKRPNDTKAVMRAVMEASIWLDNLENRSQGRAGHWQPGLRQRTGDGSRCPAARATTTSAAAWASRNTRDDYMLFHDGGKVNFPRHSHGIWFMTQYVRFEYLQQLPDAQPIARQLIMQDIYREVARRWACRSRTTT